MPLLHIVKTRMSLLGRLDAEVLSQHLPASPQVVGASLAEQVDAYARERKLGYYPALAFFQLSEDHNIDLAALDAARNIAWFAGNLLEEEIPRQLRGAFSHVLVESVQCSAFALPPVRPSRPGALAALRAHYTPDTFRMVLLLSTLYRNSQESDSAEDLARKKVLRHLRGVFEELDVTSALRVAY